MLASQLIHARTSANLAHASTQAASLVERSHELTPFRQLHSCGSSIVEAVQEEKLALQLRGSLQLALLDIFR